MDRIQKMGKKIPLLLFWQEQHSFIFSRGGSSGGLILQEGNMGKTGIVYAF